MCNCNYFLSNNFNHSCMGMIIPNKKYENMVSEILEQFDFDKCKKVMSHLNWQWYGRGIPTIDLMVETSRSHLKEVIEGLLNKENKVKPHEIYIVSSGGFKAWGYKNRNGGVDKLGLEFIVSEWDVDTD